MREAELLQDPVDVDGVHPPPRPGKEPNPGFQHPLLASELPDALSGRVFLGTLVTGSFFFLFCLRLGALSGRDKTTPTWNRTVCQCLA